MVPICIVSTPARPGGRAGPAPHPLRCPAPRACAREGVSPGVTSIAHLIASSWAFCRRQTYDHMAAAVMTSGGAWSTQLAARVGQRSTVWARRARIVPSAFLAPSGAKMLRLMHSARNALHSGPKSPSSQDRPTRSVTDRGGASPPRGVWGDKSFVGRDGTGSARASDGSPNGGGDASRDASRDRSRWVSSDPGSRSRLR